ncbi:MAG: hypothetical protein PHT94_01410 [Candidatus Nanoarchaeia archaeon]|nr:hypothetical protein [Candidatus Nanoarchaeia archaeon]
MENDINNEEYSKQMYDKYNMILEEYNLLKDEKDRISHDIKSLKNNILILNEIEKEKNLDEIYFPLFNGVYMKAKVIDKENYFMLSSNKYAIIENKNSIKDKIKENIEELEKVIGKIENILNKRKNDLDEIENSI